MVESLPGAAPAPQSGAPIAAPTSPPVRVLLVEASSGGVVGGSLTGLMHLLRGLDRTRVAASIALYETKGIEDELAALRVDVYQVRRRRLPKEHALLQFDTYHRARSLGLVRRALRTGRQSLRLLTEELPAALRLARVIRAAAADVVHLGNGLRANYDAYLACRLTRTPCLCHVKGFEKYGERERRAAASVDALVSMTKAVDDHCRASGVRAKRNLVIYDALDEGAYRPSRSAAAVRAELGIAPDALVAGVAGNIQEWKGQLVLVEAMRAVASAFPGCRALIIGGTHRAGGGYAQQLDRRVLELGLADHVMKTGFRSDIADVMNALDVVVHTSVRPEAFGRVILEGMLLGKPVVATNAGGVPELIEDGDTGFLTEPGDASALSRRLIELFGDASLRRDMGQRAQTWARQQFALDRHVAAFTELYTSLGKGN